ncbi:MAG: putative oxidoreductase [Acidimicrobiales bacterium]|nr:putative oxidoreductase [Acidimicrobiales bacterium]
MDVRDAVRRRRMVRRFAPTPVEPAVVDGLVDLARRAPSAGHTQAVACIVLEGPQTARYWDVTLPPERRATFRWDGLLAAPVLVVVLTSPGAYADRYAEDDKRAAGLDTEAAWPVPYWWVDAGAAIEHLLLGVVDAGLGACLFGAFEHEPAVLDALGVPDGWRIAGTVALGHPAPDEPGRSSARPRRPLDEVLHRGGW